MLCSVNRMSEPTPDNPTPVAGLDSCDVRQVLSSLLIYIYILIILNICLFIYIYYIYIYIQKSYNPLAKGNKKVSF